MFKFTKGKAVLWLIGIGATLFGWVAEDLFKAGIYSMIGVEDDDDLVKKIDSKDAEEDEEEKKA